jgi:D-alanyl-D-alanine carboxypeptidase/D-alanyl-D-alanine-endopeptidase (penicillin-binding protein 4)
MTRRVHRVRGDRVPPKLRLPPLLLTAALAGACLSVSAAPAAQAGPGSPAPHAEVPAHRGPLDRLRQDLNAVLGAAPLQRGIWGVFVRSLTSDEIFYELNGGKLLTPASTMKVVTLAAAADLLGWDFTYETRLMAAGAIDDGFLNGDLVVIGNGDPSIDDRDRSATQLFETWAEQLKRLGVRAVGGSLIGDDNAFDDESFGAGWAWDDLDKGFGTGVGALQYNENTARLSLLPGRPGEQATISAPPEGAGLVVRNLVTTSRPGGVADLASRRLIGSALLEIRGAIPAGGAPVTFRAAVQNPTLHFVAALKAALIAHGIEIRGPAVDVDDLAAPPDMSAATPLIIHRSAPLTDLAMRMMKSSQNLYAESLLRALAPTSGTSQEGRRAVELAAGAWGIAAGDLAIADGSGLSRYNLITPAALVGVLTHIGRDDRRRDAFMRSLPEAGRDGTLAGRMRGTAAQGNVRAKTGSLAHVRALAGYVRTRDGEPLAFTVLANNVGAAPNLIDRAADAVAVKLAEFTRIGPPSPASRSTVPDRAR